MSSIDPLLLVAMIGMTAAPFAIAYAKYYSYRIDRKYGRNAKR